MPVYIGAPNIHAYSPGPRSFIHIRDFASGQQLWEYLQLFADGADGAEAKYSQFHRWRSGGFTAVGQDEPQTPNVLGTGAGISREQVCSFTLGYAEYPSLDLFCRDEWTDHICLSEKQNHLNAFASLSL